MIIGGGSYRPDNEQMNQLKQAFMQERVDQVARSRKLHADTIKRRRALAQKKKTDAQREEQRRQVILARRKEHIREATEKYQRLNKHYDARDYIEPSPPAPQLSAGPNLEEALRAIRGPSPKRAFHRSNSVERQKGTYSPSSFRQGSASSLRQGSATSLRSNGSSTYSMHGERYSINHGTSHEHQRADFKNHTADHCKPNNQTMSQLQHRSLNNLNASKSLFEQQLEQQQSLLQEQQQQYLQEFNQAIKEEMEGDQNLAGEVEADNTYQVQRQRSESVSSADSLEVEMGDVPARHANVVCNSSEPVMLYQQLNNNHSDSSKMLEIPSSVPPVVIASSAAATNSFVIHRSVNVCSPNVAIVSPSVVSPSASQLAQPLTKSNSKCNAYGMPKVPVCSNCSIPAHKPDPIATSSAYGQIHQDTVVSNVAIQPPQTRVVYELPSSKVDSNNACNPRTQDIHCHHPSASKAWTTPSPPVTQPSNNNYKPSNHMQSIAATVAQETNERPPFVNSVAYHTQNLQKNTFINANRSTAYAVATGVTASTKSVPSSQHLHTEPVASNHLYQVVPTSPQHAQIPRHVVQESPSKAYAPSVPEMPLSPQEQEGEASSESSSGSDVEDESQPELRVIKGILKKKSGSVGGRVGRGPVRLLVQGGGKVPLSRESIRDSIEVNRDLIQRGRDTVVKKKSVWFAEKLCEEQEESTSSYRQIHFTVPSEQPTTTNTVITSQDSSKKNSPQPAPSKPSRPTSAQTMSSTPKVDPSVKNPRVVSAGRMRRGPFLRPHPPAQPRSGRATMNNHQNGYYANKSTSRYQSSNIVSAAAPEPQPAPPVEHSGISVSINTPGVESEQSQGLHPNNIKLDRTPTDDEINCLWDNVRSCLGKDETQESVKDASNMSQQHIDGSSLVPPFRASTGVNNNYANNYMGSAYPPKKKFSMEALNSFSRRNSLLHGRKNPKNISNQQQASEPSQSHTIHDLAQQKQPRQSAAYPINANSVYGTNVSESMAAFLTAEVLAQRSASESQIEAAMTEAQMHQQSHNAMHPQPRAPSALSLEEQRLMQSLERLNERLRSKSTSVPFTHGPLPHDRSVSETANVPSTPVVPKPPSFGGFKGHAPLSNNRRHVNSNGTVSRYNYRYAQSPNSAQSTSKAKEEFN